MPLETTPLDQAPVVGAFATPVMEKFEDMAYLSSSILSTR